MKIEWLPCNSDRNSMCEVPMESLDWSNWWQDAGYLHVKSKINEGTWWRVYPRHTNVNNVRVAVKEGIPNWIKE